MLFFFTNFHSYFPLFIRFHPAFDKDKILKSKIEKIQKFLVFKGKMGNLEKGRRKENGFKKGKRAESKRVKNPRTENGKGKKEKKI